MRIKATLFVAGAISLSAMSLCAFSSAWSQALIPQRTTPPPQKPPAAAAAAAPTPPPQHRPPIKATCANPNAIGVSRVVQIDTTGGPGFGFEHFKQLDFLRDRKWC